MESSRLGSWYTKRNYQYIHQKEYQDQRLRAHPGFQPTLQALLEASLLKLLIFRGYLLTGLY